MDAATAEQPTEAATLYLNKDTHEYSEGGVIITDPSVTTVLADCGLIDTRYFTKDAAERGTLVHLMCQLHDEDDLDKWCQFKRNVGLTTYLELLPYLDAWEKFKLDTGWLPYRIESPMRSRKHGFVGTPDQIGTFPYQVKMTDIDIKSGDAHYSTAFQTAAYVLLTAEDKTLPNAVSHRGAVQLRKNGTYKYIKYPVADLRRDQQTFLAALNIYQIKRLNGG